MSRSFGGDVVDQAAADVHLALGDLLQTGDHAQGGGLTAAGGADEDDELFVLDLQVEVGNGRSGSARIDLVNVLAANRSHVCASYYVLCGVCAGILLTLDGSLTCWYYNSRYFCVME